MKVQTNTLRWIAVAAIAFASISCFNVLWIIESGMYETFIQPVMWVWMLLVSLLIALPTALNGRCLLSFLILVVADLMMIANLMYLKAFGAQIPLGSYRNVMNLIDFTDALPATMSWWMLIFPVMLIVLWLLLKRLPVQKGSNRNIYWISLCVAAAATAILMIYPERVDRRLAELRQSHGFHTSITPLYSLAATWILQWQTATKSLTNDDRHLLAEFASSRRALLHDADSVRTPLRFIMIMMESMESWPIGASIEGREITPNINRLLRDTLNTLYIPRIIPEVSGGRSADAQLIDLCGLLPPEGEIYTFSFPGNSYPSIFKLLKKKTSGKTAMLTLDSPDTYNAGVMHRSLGFDILMTGKSYLRHRRGGLKSDSLLLASAANILFLGSRPMWHNGESGAAMIVTYSCHVPFRFPRDIETARYPESLPDNLARYLRNVSYTDIAIGRFIDSLRTTQDYNSTMIVLAGDHNAFGRKERSRLRSALRIVDTKPYIPLIVINSPKGGVIEREGPQSDIYPTLLQLAGLVHETEWPGVGRSFLTPYRSSAEDGILRKEISDLTVRYDLLR